MPLTYAFDLFALPILFFFGLASDDPLPSTFSHFGISPFLCSCVFVMRLLVVRVKEGGRVREGVCV